jgi:hypothetical protein
LTPTNRGQGAQELFQKELPFRSGHVFPKQTVGVKQFFNHRWKLSSRPESKKPPMRKHSQNELQAAMGCKSQAHAALRF